MKVLYLLPALSSGGVEQVVLELCQGMTAQGVECVVASAGGSMVELIEAAGARHIGLPIEKKGPKLLPAVFMLARLLKREKPDILHVHSRVPGWVARFALKMLSRKARPVLVSSFHGFHSVNAYSRIMTRGEAVIAVSRSMKEHILAHYPGVPEERIHVIPNSVDTEQNYPGFAPEETWLAEWRREHPELAGQYTLCLPGRITRIKGCAYFVPILQGLLSKGIPAHAVIVGETKRGKEKIRRDLEEAFEAAGLTKHVTWVGHRRDLREVLAACDVTLSLTLQPESFGKTVLEALALGRPVAGFDHGGVGELLEQYLPEGGVRLGDIDTLVNRLADWWHQRPRLRQPVGAPYRRQDMIASHLALYQALT